MDDDPSLTLRDWHQQSQVRDTASSAGPSAAAGLMDGDEDPNNPSFPAFDLSHVFGTQPEQVHFPTDDAPYLAQSPIPEPEAEPIASSSSRPVRNKPRLPPHTNPSASHHAKRPSSSKPPKTLSTQQKHTHHLLSEQRRRAAIRRGYELLCEEVPALREASAVLREGKRRGGSGPGGGGAVGGRKRERDEFLGKRRGREEGDGGEEGLEGMDGRIGPRSEGVVLQKTITYLRHLHSLRLPLLHRLSHLRTLAPTLLPPSTLLSQQIHPRLVPAQIIVQPRLPSLSEFLRQQKAGVAVGVLGEGERVRRRGWGRLTKAEKKALEAQAAGASVPLGDGMAQEQGGEGDGTGQQGEQGLGMGMEGMEGMDIDSQLRDLAGVMELNLPLLGSDMPGGEGLQDSYQSGYGKPEDANTGAEEGMEQGEGAGEGQEEEEEDDTPVEAPVPTVQTVMVDWEGVWLGGRVIEEDEAAENA